MPRLIDVNGSVKVLNDRDQVVAVFDATSGLLVANTGGISGSDSGKTLPTADPHDKGKPYSSSGALKYSSG